MAFSTFCACGVRSEERGTGEGGLRSISQTSAGITVLRMKLAPVPVYHRQREFATIFFVCVCVCVCPHLLPVPTPIQLPPAPYLSTPHPPKEEEGKISRAQMQPETKELSEVRDITRYVRVRRVLSSRLPVSVAQISCCDATLKAFQIRHRIQAIANTIDKYSSPFHGRVPSIKAANG